MGYSGAQAVGGIREELSKALVALQNEKDIPDDVMAVTQNIAGATGALFEAEQASGEADGKSGVKSALGSLSQTLALLQDVKSSHSGIEVATQAIAKVMGKLYQLSNSNSLPPPPKVVADTMMDLQRERQKQLRSQPPPEKGKRSPVEANIGATTQSNFYVGFSGEVSEGGVFVATYDILTLGSLVDLTVTLPGNFVFACKAKVRFVRDPFDLTSDSEPGIGCQFEALDAHARELILRFIKKRAPLFFDDEG